MDVATWWDPLVARAFTLAAIAALVVIGGRVYTRAILHTGPLLSLGEALSAGATAGARPMRSGPGRP
jgi:ABC-2 type transport system permease protein